MPTHPLPYGNYFTLITLSVSLAQPLTMPRYRHNPLIHEIHADRRYPDPGRALKMLERIAALIYPTMAANGFTVGQLFELSEEKDFSLPNRNLLGMNRDMGKIIWLRLRERNEHNIWLHEDSIMETMLHELTVRTS